MDKELRFEDVCSTADFNLHGKQLFLSALRLIGIHHAGRFKPMVLAMGFLFECSSTAPFNDDFMIFGGRAHPIGMEVHGYAKD